MKPILVFDYDGTINNTMTLYEPAIREICSWLLANNYAKEANPSKERIASWLGMNAREMWKDFMPDLDPDIRLQAEKMVGEYMMSRVRNHEAKWYPEVEETLDLLKRQGYKMVILSNSKKITGETHFKAFDMGRWFDKWYDCESFNWAPKTDIIKVLMGMRRCGKSAMLELIKAELLENGADETSFICYNSSNFNSSTHTYI